MQKSVRVAIYRIGLWLVDRSFFLIVGAPINPGTSHDISIPVAVKITCRRPLSKKLLRQHMFLEDRFLGDAYIFQLTSRQNVTKCAIALQ